MTVQELTLFIQVGEAVVPVVTAALDDIKAFVAARNGNLDVLAQLTENATTIADTDKIVDDELATVPPPVDPA